MTRRADPLLAGWREWAALPALGIAAVKVKVDTGALTSALHAIHVHRLTVNGSRRVRFDIHPLQRRSDLTVTCEADLVDERLVRSSTGHEEYRPVIRTPIRLGDRQWTIDITLTNRDSMGFRMLLGRRAMRGRIIVDPTHAFLCGSRSD